MLVRENQKILLATGKFTQCDAGKFIVMSSNSLSNEEKESVARLCAGDPLCSASMQSLPLAERYIVSRCHQVTEETTSALDRHQFAEAGRAIYDFLWDELADWYIEVRRTESLHTCHCPQTVAVQG